MTRVTVACLDMAGTTVADDGTVLEAFAAAVADLHGAAFERAMTDVRSSMGQSKIEVFRRILGDEAAARKANEAFEDHYAAAVRRGAISAVPGAEDTIMRLRDQQMLPDRHVGEQANVLKGPRDSRAHDLVRGLGRYVVTLEQYFAFAGTIGTGDNIECRSLARAVRADDSDNLT